MDDIWHHTDSDTGEAHPAGEIPPQTCKLDVNYSLSYAMDPVREQKLKIRFYLALKNHWLGLIAPVYYLGVLEQRTSQPYAQISI